MVEGIELLFQRIADAMTGIIPEEWAEAEFHAIFYSESSIYEAEYIRLANGATVAFQPASDGSKAIRELRRAFQQSGQPVWGQMWFVLKADGTFNLRWGYDDCEANGDTRFEEEAEVRRHEARRARLVAGRRDER